MLAIEKLAVSYGKHIALHDVGLVVGHGEPVVILGAYGAGTDPYTPLTLPTIYHV